MISAAHSTIDIAEPARDIERAAAIFAHSEGATFPPEAISNLRLAVVLLMAIVPHSTQYEAERAVIAEFMTRAERKLGHVRDAAGLLRAAHKARTRFVDQNLTDCLLEVMGPAEGRSPTSS